VSWRAVLDMTFCDQFCQILVADKWLSPGTMIYPTNEIDRYDIIVIFFKVTLHTMALTLYYGTHNVPSCLPEIYDDIFTIVNVI
jgi:hypothetical protein